MNNVILMGRLTKDPEIRTTNSGLSVCKFTVAVDRYSKDGEDKTDFINCVAWRKTAEFIDKHFSKGQRILLSGSIQTGSYEKDGRTVYTTDVLVDKAEFCENKKNSDSAPAPTRAREPKETEETEETEDIALDISEDLPF